MAERRRYIVVMTEAATAEVEEVASVHRARQPGGGAARLHAASAGRRLESLGTYPRRGRVVPELARVDFHQAHELLVGPYRLLYSIEGRRVTILAVF